MDSIRADGGVALMAASSLRAHCAATGSGNADTHFHAALCFLQSPHVSIALKKYRAESGASLDGAERQFIRAINLSRPGFLDDDETLYEKGLIKTPSGYRIAHRTLAHGSDFDEARRKLHPACSDILFNALDMTLGRKSHNSKTNIRPMTLNYIAVQLMMEGAGKEFKLNKLSQVVSPRRHLEELSRSARIIHDLAKDLDIIFKGAMPLIRESTPLKPSDPRPRNLSFDQSKTLKIIIRQDAANDRRLLAATLED